MRILLWAMGALLLVAAAAAVTWVYWPAEPVSAPSLEITSRFPSLWSPEPWELRGNPAEFAIVAAAANFLLDGGTSGRVQTGAGRGLSSLDTQTVALQTSTAPKCWNGWRQG